MSQYILELLELKLLSSLSISVGNLVCTFGHFKLLHESQVSDLYLRIDFMLLDDSCDTV